ncbi:MULTISPECIES: hypothetical protein [unclassified Schlesneria]|uniref:hypothetical protein n=1 Tax=Schlesneria TaxID=656899 RepID=UPI002EE92EA6
MLSRCALFAVIAIIGCGGGGSTLKVVPVSGTVNYKGQPVKGAVVTFATDKTPRTAVGVCDASGKFKLTTINSNDGAVPGEHVITIVTLPEPGSAMPANASPTDYLAQMQQAQQSSKGKKLQPPGAGNTGKLIPAKYADASKSGLKRTVVPGEKNDFTFDLTDD